MARFKKILYIIIILFIAVFAYILWEGRQVQISDKTIVESIGTKPVAQEPATLEEALALYSTPFIDDYRARYDANENKAMLLSRMQDNCEHFREALEFKIPCTEQDMENLKKLAQWEDMASLAIAPRLIKNSELKKQALKQAADMGEIDSMAFYGREIGVKDFELGKQYIDAAKARGYMPAYGAAAGIYLTLNMIDEYCAAMEEGYQKFGLIFIRTTFLSSSTYPEPYLPECVKETAEEFLERENTYEAKLMQGYLYLIERKDTEAKELFQEIYEKSDNAEIALNAGFCLGAMYYSGTAVEKDTEYGLRLMQESVDGGYTMIFHIPEIQMMPAEYRITTYANFCEVLRHNLLL